MPADMIESLDIAPFHPASDEMSEATFPPMIRASLARHRENLHAMMTALRATGLDDQAIESHLSVIIESYRAELSAALLQLGKSA